MDDLLFDVGGTRIKCNIWRNGQRLLTEDLQFSAISQSNKENLLAHFCEIIQQMMSYSQKTGGTVRGVAFAFPGPFNYEMGISQMQGLGKYDALYGVDLKSFFLTCLSNHGVQEVPILFENDARAFALGEYQDSTLVQRGIYLTLGTGLGSAFIQEGEFVTELSGINREGMIYDIPFRGDILDNWLSAAGLQKLAAAAGYPKVEAFVLAKAARSKEPQAQAIFGSFGELLGEALKDYCRSFRPDEMVFGGQVSRSFPLFEGRLREVLAEECPATLRVSGDLTTAALRGLYKRLEERRGVNP